MIHSQFIDHLALRVAELGATERFYTALLGPPPHRTADSIMYEAGDLSLMSFLGLALDDRSRGTVAFQTNDDYFIRQFSRTGSASSLQHASACHLASGA